MHTPASSFYFDAYLKIDWTPLKVRGVSAQNNKNKMAFRFRDNVIEFKPHGLLSRFHSLQRVETGVRGESFLRFLAQEADTTDVARLIPQQQKDWFGWDECALILTNEAIKGLPGVRFFTHIVPWSHIQTAVMPVMRLQSYKQEVLGQQLVIPMKSQFPRISPESKSVWSEPQPFVLLPWECPPLVNTCAIDVVIMTMYILLSGRSEFFTATATSAFTKVLAKVFALLQKGEFLQAKKVFGAFVGFDNDAVDYECDLNRAFLDSLHLNPWFANGFEAHAACENPHCPDHIWKLRETIRVLEAGVNDLQSSLNELVIWSQKPKWEFCMTCHHLCATSAYINSGELRFMWLHLLRTGNYMVENTVKQIKYPFPDGPFFRRQAYLFHGESKSFNHFVAYIYLNGSHFSGDRPSGWYFYDGILPEADRFKPLEEPLTEPETVVKRVRIKYRLEAILYVRDDLL
jgi:hypothetical protein